MQYMYTGLGKIQYCIQEFGKISWILTFDKNTSNEIIRICKILLTLVSQDIFIKLHAKCVDHEMIKFSFLFLGNIAKFYFSLVLGLKYF